MKSDVKRNLPSWMNAAKDPRDDDDDSGKGKSSHHSKPNFSKSMEGVVFVLSGFVNPERGTLRSQALEMGAEFQQDWNSNSTLLVCAFPNTPKYRQVAADGGTIVSKDWINECHEQRKLVEIEPYLLHAGNPWKRQKNSLLDDKKPSTSQKAQSRVVKGQNSMPSTSVHSKDVASNCVEESFSSSKVKKWVAEDLKRTISWLENQDEKPESSQIKGIAAEGVLTFLQDTIDALQQGQDIKSLTEQWAHVPLVVEELVKFDDGGSFPSPGKRELCKHAIACKKIYELELHKAESSSSATRNERKEYSSGVDGNRNDDLAKDDASYDSDETIEMTEEDIDQAYNTVASTIVHGGA